MNEINILFVGKYLFQNERIRGGPPRVLSEIVDSLSKEKNVNIFVFSQSENNIFSKIKYRNINILILPKYNLNKVINLYRSLRSKIDIIFIFGEYAISLPILLDKSKRKIYSFHGIALYEYLFNKSLTLANSIKYIYLQKIIAEQADCLVSVSRLSLNNFMKITKVKKPSIVIPNGVKPCRLEESIDLTSPFLTQTISRLKYPIILFVGRCDIIKGLHILLKAITELKNKYHLVIVGRSSPFFTKIRLIFSKFFEQKRIIYLGLLKPHELDFLYRCARVLVIPSLFDTFPLASLEAMIRGTPVIVSNMVGTSEIIRNWYNGLIFNVNDVRQLTEYLEIILSDEKLARKIGLNGKKIASKLTWDFIAKEYLNLAKRFLHEG